MGVLNTITCNMDIDVSMLDLKQLFFNNLVLLGFDAHSMEAANHIPFNKSMFELPNKRGAEIVLYYLFQRLNATMCKEAFRDCWPILDKKREQSFRKTCYNWLSNISQEEPDSHLPRINASLFMSPGGDKFYQMLFHFSGYVLQKVLETELGSKLTDRLRYPTLSQDNLQLGEVIIKTLACSSVRHRTNYFTAAQLNIKANRTWKETADEYVKEYRKLNKEVRELDFQYREEEQRSVEAAMARGSPAKRRSGQDDKFDSEFDPRTIKRSQRIQQVREMWKQVEDFDRNKEAEREVVESIVQKTINKYKLDGSDINVKVPDMLLRECGEEIRRRNVDNTYQGGKLNLVSVLQLWSLCLHLYLEKLNQVGLPKFEEEVKKLTAQAHLQQNYAQNAQTLRQQMSERIPVLKSSIEKLSQKLDSTLFVDQSPESIRTTSVGLGLVGPSPKPSFSPDKGMTPAGGIGVPRLLSSAVETPEAINQISEQVKASVRRGTTSLFKSADLQLDKKLHETMSSLPRPRDSQPSSRHSSRPTSARSTASSKKSLNTTPRSSKEKVVRHTATKSKDDQSFTKVSSPRTMMEKLPLGDISLVSDIGRQDSSAHAFHPLSALSDRSNRSNHTITAGSDKLFDSPRSVKSNTSEGRSVKDDTLTDTQQNAGNVGRKTPTDLLVDEIMGDGEILSPFNSGMEAFQTRSEIQRSPELMEALKHEGITSDHTLMTEHIVDNSADGGPDINAGQFVDIEGPELEYEHYLDDVELDESEVGIRKIESCDKNMSANMNAGKAVRDDVDLDRDIDTADVNEYNTSKTDAITGELDAESDEEMQLLVRGREAGELVGDIKGINDDVVKDMIEEGIRQVTCDGLRDLEEDGDDIGRTFDGNDNLQVEEVLGPELEDADDLSDVSQRSTEDAIVIDKSLNMTPKVKSERGKPVIRSPDSPVRLLEDEQFPSLENSPREAIVIDSSLHTPNRDGQSNFLSFSSADVWKVNKPLSTSPDVLSLSLQGGLFGEKAPLSKDILSRSLVMDRSPLSDEIRKMFKKAVADTPPQEENNMRSGIDLKGLDLLEGKDNVDETGREHKSDYGRQVLKQTDISWDTTENIDDIELPSFSENEDVDIDALLQKGENLLQLECDGLDDFFASKTPELPKRSQPTSREESTEWPTFPPSDNHPSPLISFTP